MPIVRRARLSAAAAALLLTACGSGGSGSPFPSATVTPLPPRSASPRNASSSAPVASALVGPSPVSPAVVDVADPDLELRLPPGWTALTPQDLRARVELAKANAPEAYGDLYDELLRQIEDGELRAGGFGPVGYEPWRATLVVEVTRADSVDAQIDRNARAQPAIIKPKATLRSAVATPLGDGVRVMVTADPPVGAIGAVAARSITFYVDLGDGRILWITS